MFIAPILWLYNPNKGLFYSILDSVQQTRRSLTPHCDKLRLLWLFSDPGEHSEHAAPPRDSDERRRVPLSFQGESRTLVSAVRPACRQERFLTLCLRLQKPADSTIVQQTETEKKTPNETNGDEFNSFQFWREPLPAIDDELLGLLVRKETQLCLVRS